MAGTLHATHRAEAQALSAGPSPLPAVAVGAILLAGGALLTTFVLRFLGTAAATTVLVAALCLAALAAHRRSVPASLLFAATLFPGLGLWIETTDYVARNAYADYRIVELDDDGRALGVSGQAASRARAARACPSPPYNLGSTCWVCNCAANATSSSPTCGSKSC